MNRSAKPKHKTHRHRLLQLLLVLLVLLLIFALAIRAAVMWRLAPAYDEIIFAYAGWVWLSDGGLPYRDLADNKPPLVYLFSGVSNRLFGPTFLPMRIACTAALLCMGALVGLMGRIMGYKVAAILAALGASILALSPGFGDPRVQAEPFMIVLVVGMMVVAFWAQRANRPLGLLMAGCIGGTAFLFKQTCALELVAVSTWLLIGTDIPRRRRAAQVGLLVLGFVIPSLLFIAWASRAQILPDYVGWVYGSLFDARSPSPTSILQRVGRFSVLINQGVRPLIPLALGAVAFLWLRRRLPAGQNLVTLWLAFAAVGPLLGWSYRHHFVQVVPPLALATVMVMSWVWRKLHCQEIIVRHNLWPTAAAVCVSAVGIIAWSHMPLLYQSATQPAFSREASPEYELARTVRSRAHPGDTLLPWDASGGWTGDHQSLLINIYSGRRSPTRHPFNIRYNCSPVTEEVIETLRNSPPRFVAVYEGEHGPGHRDYSAEELPHRAQLEAWVSRMIRSNYRLVAAAGNYSLYERTKAADTTGDSAWQHGR